LVTLWTCECVWFWRRGKSTILDGVRRTIKENEASGVPESKMLVLVESSVQIGQT